MRIRTIAALVTGTALGVGGAWLFDPDAGPDRRRRALRTAWAQAREVDWAAVAQRVGAATEELGRRAAAGYEDGATRGR